MNSSHWGTLTKTEVKKLREFYTRFITVCPDEAGKIDPADKERIRKVARILWPPNGIEAQKPHD